MSQLTYRQLQAQLKNMSEEQLDMTVTLYDADNDECHGIDFFAVTGQEAEDDLRPESDVLDDGHPYLMKV